jgi:hypothetical protein
VSVLALSVITMLFWGMAPLRLRGAALIVAGIFCFR